MLKSFKCVDLLVSILVCVQTTPDGKSYSYYIPSLVCWEGQHLGHAVICTFAAVLFSAICILLQYTYYEARNTLKNPLSKVNASSDVFMTLSKIANVILFSFFRTVCLY